MAQVISLVQTGIFASSINATSYGLTVPFVPTIGNRMVATIATFSSVTISSIVQTGVTWTFVGRKTNAGDATIEIWISDRVAGVAGQLITITQSSALPSSAIVSEWTGLNGAAGLGGWDVNTAGNEATSTNPSVLVQATNFDKELWICAYAWRGDTSIFSTPTNSFLLTGTLNTAGLGGSGVGVAQTHRIVSAIGNLNSSGTLSIAAPWASLGSSFIGPQLGQLTHTTNAQKVTAATVTRTHTTNSFISHDSREQLISIEIDHTTSPGANIGSFDVELLGVSGNAVAPQQYEYERPPQQLLAGTGPNAKLYVNDPLVKTPI